MQTLADALLAAAEGLEQIFHGHSTGGSTTTLIDVNDTQPDNIYNNGTIFFIDRKLTRAITSYDSATHTYVFAALATPILSGERYAVLTSHYTLGDLIASVNSALVRIGKITKVTFLYPDVAGKESYSLPSDTRDVIRVEYSTADDEPYDWVRSYYWDEVDGLLMFDNGKSPDDATIFRIFYRDYHAELEADTDEIHEAINLTRLKWEAMQTAAQMRSTYTGNKEETTAEIMKLAMQKSAEYAVRYPVVNRVRDPHLNG